MKVIDVLIEQLSKELGSKILSSHDFRGDETIVVAPADVAEVARHLRDNPAYAMEFLMDLTVVDWLDEAPRFEVVYHFFSRKSLRRLRVKARVAAEKPHIPSLSHLYKSADWMEREAWEFYGVVFDGHPNLVHCLLYPEFKGFPLRKDYPKGGEQPLIEFRTDRFMSSDMPPGTG